MKTSKPNPSDSNSQYKYPSPFISAYSPKQRVQIAFTGTGRTKQAFKAECDVNNIMARYLKTGVLEARNQHAPRYGDCTGIEYQAGMLAIAGAKEAFAALPAKLRDRFENDPAKFLEFVQDDKNLEEARGLGLLKPKAPEATPLPTPPASDAPTPPLPSRKAMREQARADGERKSQED